MKKGFLIVLSALLLITSFLFTACDSWMQDDDFYSDIENDVKVANAQQISVYVRYALTKQGKTDPDGSAVFKVEIPHEISATTEPEFGFVRWAAFSTEFLATGDNQSQNKDIYYIDDEDYNERIAPNEITAPAVVFEDASQPDTKVTINVARNDIFLVPIVAQRPAVSLTIPAKGQSNVVRNMSVRINFSKPMDPDSFKNEAGVFDKITIEQGTQAFGADGDIEIVSDDITNRFETPVFSKNKKMITLKFKPTEINEGYTANSIVSVTIAKDVKDVYGFTMAEDDKVSFSIGSFMDTLAPRITQLNAWTTLNTSASSFKTFEGMYKDAATRDHAGTPMNDWQLSGTDIGADDAPASNLDSAFFDPFAPLQSSSETGYRVTDSLYIRVYAEDIAASGTGITDLTEKLSEPDVAMIGARATLMYAADGSAPSSPVVSDVTSFNYLPQGKTSDIEGSYQTIIGAINNVVTPPGENPVYSANTGFLFKYDLSSMPDGLIRIDVFGVDMVQNSGLTEGGIYSAEYGNGYASLFVVKDTTPPDAAANATHVVPDVSQATAAHYFNNTAGNSHNRSKIKINGDTSSIVDSGHERLRSKHNNIKWVAKLTSDTGWKNTVSASAWTSVTNALGGDSNPSYFAAPAVQGQIPFTYALMDDLGNISNVVAISPANPVYYDSVIPSVGTLNWTPESGSTAGIAKENILTKQTLVIPITEATSGIKELEFTITRDDNSVSSDPLSAITLSGTSTSYTKSGKTLTFNSPVTGSPSITVKGLTLTDTTIGESENYTVAVKVKDAADNISIIKNTLISIDSVEPEIRKLYIPGITGTAEISSTGTVGTETKYWINNTSTSSSIPRTYIDITFEETGSGAKVFDFADSTVKLTADSALYVNYGTASQRQISATVNTGNKTLTVNSHADAGAYLAKKDNSGNAVPVTVRITNIELASSSTDSKAAVIIRDTATNVSGLFKTIVSDNNLQLTPNAEGYSCFRYDYVTPSAASPSLTDRNSTEVESTETSATGKTAAESGYTNEAYINASVTLYPKTSGIASLTISGDAVFDANTKLYIGSNEIFYSRSADGKTATFQESATDNGSAVITASSSVSLRIEDLKLTAGEGTNRVSFYPKGFGGLYNSSISSSSIVLDTTPPEWDGSGIYGYGDSNYYDSVYPHSNSSSSSVAGLTNVNPDKPNDIYFYFNDGRPNEDSTYNLNIKAKTVETNKRSDAILFTIGSSSFTKGDGDSFCNKGFGKYTAVVRDKAGNKSTVKTFYIVKDESFANDASELTAIDNYMTIVMPDSSARVFANTGTKTHQYSDFNYLESTNTDNCPMITRDYIIKQAANPYKIKIKLASGTTSSDKQVDGKTAVPTDGNTAYNRLKATTSSAPLEYYSVSHWYAQFSSTSGDLQNNRFEPFNPDNIPGTKKLSWHKYQASSSDYTDTDIKSRVDSDGNIEIEIPRTTSCAPLSILLKDACGNITWRLIRPFSFNEAEGSYTNNYSVAWIVDKEVGVYNEVGDGVHLNGTAEISSGGYGNDSDVAFYNNTVTLNIHHLTESCRFVTDGDNQPKFLTYSTSPSFVYTLKSRIIAWTASGKPGRDAFGSDDGSKPASTPAASDWCFVQQATNGGYPIFNVTNSFPMPNINDCYKLFLLLEDTVGNYEIRQIRCASDNSIVVSTSDPSSTEKPYWLYDATGPTVNNFTYYKINQVADGSNTYNYYSNNSYVKYTVSDSGAGVWNAGKGETSYPGWNSMTSNRRTISNYEVNLNSYASLNGTTLKISKDTIYDYAGNTTSSDITLNNNSNNKWRKLTSAPTLRATNAAVAVNTTLFAGENDNLTGNTETHSDTSGQELLLTAKWGVTNITIKLYANQSGTETGDTGILGWVVRSSPITSFADFYSTSDVSSDVTWDSTCWKYDYSKGVSDLGRPWHDLYPGAKYFYPVNKAGLICQTPVKVKFKTNKKPTITNGTSASGYDYTDNGTIGKINADYLKNDAPSTAHLIKVSGTGASAINYTKYGASVTFTTTEGPTKYRFVYSGTDGVLGTNNGTNDDTYGDWSNLSGSGPSYTISLGSEAVGTALGIQLARGNEEDSDVYPLYGPSFTGHAGSNNWVYDSVTPGIAFANNTNPIKSGSASGSAAATFTGDETKYIQAANAFISFVLLNKDSTEHYQWTTKTGSTWSNWTDISPSNMDSSNGQLTFPAPENKTEYKFRAVDAAGNISTATDAVKLQRDEWAPEAAGGLEYHLRAGETNVTTPGMDIAFDNAGTVDEDTRVISYSKTSTNTSYYIDSIRIKLSNVTDKRDNSGNVSASGIERSGIKKYEVYFNGILTYSNTPSVSDDYWEITGLESNTDNTVYTYKLKVIDNLGQTKTLKTFQTNADGQAPDLELITGDSLVQKATDAQGAGATDWVPKNASTTYYLNSAYTIINLKKTATDVFKYQVTTDGGSSWDDITPQVDTTTSPHTVKYIFATPSSATYQFRAIDGVGNASEPTDAITIKKDTLIPNNTVTWTFNKTSSSDSTDVATYYKETSSGSGVMTYNGNRVNQFVLDVSSIASASDTSGIRRYWLKIGDTKFDSLTASSSAFDSSSKTWTPGIATTGSEEVSYQIWAEDWAGNTTDVKEFKLTNDVEPPVISFADSDIVQTKAGDETAVNAIPIGEDSNKVYYLNKAKAVINLKTSSTDIKDYQVIIGDADPAPITSSSGLSTSSLSYTFAAPRTPTTYSFKVIDNVGNESSATGTVKLVLDDTPPALKEEKSALSYAVLKENGDAATPVSDTILSADYVLSTEETTTTITYNPAVVKTISFYALASELSEYATDGADSGYAKLYYKSDTGSAHDMGGTGFNVITLGDKWNETYSIYAEDKVGNQSAALMTFKFVADSAGPVPDSDINNSNDKINVNNKEITINKLHSYRHNHPKPRGENRYIPFATLKKVGGHAKVNYYTEETTIKYAASLIPGAVQYQIVQSVNDDDGYKDVSANGTWKTITKDGDDFVFALPAASTDYATTPYTRLAFFFMDAVGNKTGPYYLGNDESKEYGIQWWILDSAITSRDITISGATWNPNQSSYGNVKVELPVGTVVHKIEAGDSNVTINGVTFKEADSKYFDTSKLNNIEYIYQNNGSNPGIEMNITVTNGVTDSSAVKIKINGVEQGVFVRVQINPNINRVGGSRIIRGGVAAPVSDSDESTGSRFVQFINNVQDTFAPASEVSLDNSVAEKPAKKAKKAAKKAKKQAKKASGKVVSTGSTTAAVEKPVMAVETAEILEQTLTSNVPEVAVAGESVVSEIAGVTEKVNAAEQVVSIRPTGYSTTAEAEATTADAGDAADVAEKKTPSKSASIVIMLAILSSFSAVWYLQRNRKK